MALQIEKYLYRRKSQAFYDALNEKSRLSKTDEFIEVYASIIYKIYRLLMFLPEMFFTNAKYGSITSGKTELSTFYMYDEATFRKGSN